MVNKSKEIKEGANVDDGYLLIEKGVFAALETYSNVHRGTGHFSRVTTHLFEQARKIVLEYLGLNKRIYSVVFCTPYRAEIFKSNLDPDSFRQISSKDFGLSFGVRAIVVKKATLRKTNLMHTGGGTARLMSPEWVVWESGPDRFEAGTPAIINIIAFARTLLIARKTGKEYFQIQHSEKSVANKILYHDDFENYTGIQLLNRLRETRFGNNIAVPTTKGKKSFVNLDYAASTPTFRPIWDVVSQVWRQPEKIQKEIIPDVKSICADFFGAPETDYEVIFTSNTTEAINIAAENFNRLKEPDFEPVLVTTLLEHSSNDLPWRMLPGSTLLRLTANKSGFLDLLELEKLLCNYNRDHLFGIKRIHLVAVSGASNVLGTCNELKEISRIVHNYGANLLVDAAQLVAHRKIDMMDNGIDYLAFSAHKVYAPFGSGALVVKRNLLNFKQRELQLIQASGEENIGGIAAMGKALMFITRIGFEQIEKEEQNLTKRLINGLKEIPGIIIHGIADTNSKEFKKRGGVVIFHFKGTDSGSVAKKLAMQGGIGVRYGCHCSHILVKHILGVGPNLERFQRFFVNVFPKIQLPGVARISFGIGTTEEEIDMIIKVLKDIGDKLVKKTGTPGNEELPRSRVKKQIHEFIKDMSFKVYDQI